MARPKLMSQKDPEQVYWTPEQAAKKFATSQSHLRVIEKELGFNVSQVPLRQDWTIRRYTRKEIDIIGLVIHANNLGLPLQTVKHWGIDRLPEIVEFFTNLSKADGRD